MVKEGWPESDDIVTNVGNPEHSTMNREYCESFQSTKILSYHLLLARFGPGAEISFFFGFGGSISTADESIPSDVEGRLVQSHFSS